MNPVGNISTTKATSKPPLRTKRKKKRDLGANAAAVAETPSEFSFAIAKTTVAQICQSVGYRRSTHEALETLTNVATKYLQAIARSAASFANASNRTDANLFDLIDGIHDLCSVQGYPSDSKMRESDLLRSGPLKEVMNFVYPTNEVPFAKPIPCLLRSGALKEIMNFVNLSNEVPFAKPIPRKNVSGIDSGSSMCSFKKAKLQGLHIPEWLPDLPEETLHKNRDKVLFKERKCGEMLWEHSLAVKDCSGNVDENRIILQRCGINGREEKDAAGMELVAQERERVKFKIGGEEDKQKLGLGVNMMNGVCKGRKRVSWMRDKINDCMVEGNEDERSVCKRKNIA